MQRGALCLVIQLTIQLVSPKITCGCMKRKEVPSFQATTDYMSWKVKLLAEQSPGIRLEMRYNVFKNFFKDHWELIGRCDYEQKILRILNVLDFCISWRRQWDGKITRLRKALFSEHIQFAKSRAKNILCSIKRIRWSVSFIRDYIQTFHCI